MLVMLISITYLLVVVVVVLLVVGVMVPGVVVVAAVGGVEYRRVLAQQPHRSRSLQPAQPYRR